MCIFSHIIAVSVAAKGAGSGGAKVPLLSPVVYCINALHYLVSAIQSMCAQKGSGKVTLYM